MPKPESGEEDWYENGTLDEFQEEEVWDEKLQAKEEAMDMQEVWDEEPEMEEVQDDEVWDEPQEDEVWDEPQEDEVWDEKPQKHEVWDEKPQKDEVWDEKPDEEVWDEKLQDEEVWDEPQDAEVWDEKPQDEEVWDEMPQDEEVWEEAWYAWSNAHACLAHVFYCCAQEEDWPEDDEEAGVSHAKAKDLNSWCCFVCMVVPQIADGPWKQLTIT